MHPTCNYPHADCGQPAVLKFTIDDPEVLVNVAYTCEFHASDALVEAPGRAVVEELEPES